MSFEVNQGNPKGPRWWLWTNEKENKNLLCAKVKIVLEDTFLPAEFLASHQYSPWWADVMEWKVSTEAPFIPVVLSAATGNPSLYHVSTGRGTPDASQLILILLPAETYIWRGGFTVNLGGDGSKIKTQKTNHWWKTKFGHPLIISILAFLFRFESPLLWLLALIVRTVSFQIYFGNK